MFEHTMCSSNLQGTQVRETIITCESPVTLVIEGGYIYKRPFFGNFTRVKRLGRDGQKLDPIQLQAPLGL